MLVRLSSKWNFLDIFSELVIMTRSGMSFLVIYACVYFWALICYIFPKNGQIAFCLVIYEFIVFEGIIFKYLILYPTLIGHDIKFFNQGILWIQMGIKINITSAILFLSLI